MTRVILKHGNVLEAETDAICLTVDGELIVPSEKKNDRRYGNIANAFARRWPDVLESERWYPLRYGKVHSIEPDEDECSFCLVVLASVLPHPHSDQTLNIGSLQSAVRHALQGMAHEVLSSGLSSCAMGLIKCGWRLTAKDALKITVDALNSPAVRSSGVTVQVYVNEENEYESLISYAVGLGIEI